jgi:hypothetical protein
MVSCNDPKINVTVTSLQIISIAKMAAFIGNYLYYRGRRMKKNVAFAPI